ncbi:MAG: hypothetical protein M3Q07_11580 [Pseudobdellovibrionaceae bacterium]|nr:hypothetical protein [Pseudobdellovibrionaceae bacterium]
MNVLQYSILLCLTMVMNLSQRGEAATPIPFNLDAQKLDGQFMGESVEYFEDTGGKLDANEVIARWAEWPILAGQKPIINLAFTPHPLWFRWAVENPGSSPRVLLIEHPYPSDSFRVYPLLNNQLGSPFILGYKEKESGALPFRNPTLRLEIPPGRHLIYFRMQHIGAVKFAVKVWSEEAFATLKWNGEWLLGMFMGLTLIMVFYNIFMFIMMKTQAYLSYVGFLFSSLLWLTFYSGLGRMTPAGPKAFFAYTWIPLMFCMMFFLVVFTVQFLKLKERQPRMAKVFRVLSYLGVAGAVMSLFAPHSGFYLSMLVNSAYAIPLFRGGRFFSLEGLPSGLLLSRQLSECCRWRHDGISGGAGLPGRPVWVLAVFRQHGSADCPSFAGYRRSNSHQPNASACAD